MCFGDFFFCNVCGLSQVTENGFGQRDKLSQSSCNAHQSDKASFKSTYQDLFCTNVLFVSDALIPVNRYAIFKKTREKELLNMLHSFTTLYSLSKTLRFQLIPIGKTEQTFQQKNLLAQDEE